MSVMRGQVRQRKNTNVFDFVMAQFYCNCVLMQQFSTCGLRSTSQVDHDQGLTKVKNEIFSCFAEVYHIWHVNYSGCFVFVFFYILHVIHQIPKEITPEKWKFCGWKSNLGKNVQRWSVKRIQIYEVVREPEKVENRCANHRKFQLQRESDSIPWKQLLGMHKSS